MKVIRIIILAISLFAFQSVNANVYKVSYITSDDGLARNNINHVFRDSRGFMWFSTSNGLDRFDGYDFIHFNSYNRENSLPSIAVHCVNEDRNGNLWIGTENGLFFYEYKTGEIIDFAKKHTTTSGLTHNNIKTIAVDEDGNLWIVHGAGIALMRINNLGNCKVEEVYKSKNVESVVFYNGSIYVGDDNDVFRLIKTNKLEYSRVDTDDKLQDLVGTVNVIFNDKNLFWVGTSNGLYKYDLNTEFLTYYKNIPAQRSSLSSNVITSISRSNEGKILIATLIGLNIYDYNSDSFLRITSETYPQQNALNNNFLSCVVADNSAIWVATEKGGVNLLVPENNFFTNVVYRDNQIGGLTKNPVNAIYEDLDGDLFVGTVEGGLNIRKKGSPNFIQIQNIERDNKSLSHNSVSAITQDYNKDYWIGTWGLGLNKLNYKDKLNPNFKHFVDDLQQKNRISSNFVATVLADEKTGGLFVGTVNGLDFIDIATERIYPILRQLPDEKAIKLITGTLIDSNRKLWVGTGNGLFCIDLNRSEIRKGRVTFRHYHYKLTDPTSGVVEKINCILETKNNRLWFGSNGNGIYSLIEKENKSTFVKHDESLGLIDNVVYGMLEDEAGTFWISTDKGLCAYDPGLDNYRSFTIVDGLVSNQFYWDSYFKGRDGKMYFGHIAGFTWFDPLKYNPQPSTNTVEITRISVLNQHVFPAQKAQSSGQLQFRDNELIGIMLKESDKTFSVEFSSLSYFFPEKIKYAYRLKGFDNNWKEVKSERRFANFTNIKNGKYLLEIKCSNADGAWSEQIKTLEIKVIPPFYKTWWFLLLSILLIISIVYSYYKYRINSLINQESQLRELVDVRTSEIEQQKEILQEQAIQLKQNMTMLLDHQDEVSRQNEMLVKQNHEITRQKESLEELTREVKEASVDKIAFFTNITHEFRTPIALILGPVERALKLSANQKVIEQLDIVKRNSGLLLSLVNQLMDFRKVDSGKMELNLTNQNFIEFIEDIILPFSELVMDRGITFRTQFKINSPEFLFDRDNMRKVFSNLLSNAIKFAPDYSAIVVIASTYFDKIDQQEKLYVAVKDYGKGVPDGDRDKIFERFYQSKQNQAYSGYGQSGTGIGLYLCKKIIDLHNGKIEMLNLHVGGTCFRFIIPIERRKPSLVSLDGKPLEMLVTPEPNNSHSTILDINRGKPILLVVEDNSDMRHYIRSIMSEDYNILEAPNGVIGLEITKRYQPDLIISDIMMPEMDGIELCHQLKTNFVTSHIPIVLLTAKSATDTQIESFHKGADAFLVKPFDEDLLKAMIQSLMEKRKRIQMSFSENMDPEVLNFDDESLDKKFMDKALKTVRDNYINPDFDVTEFIDLMGISRSLLHKKLSNLAGQSASRFIRVYRLNIAREMIVKNRESHSLNISEIAYEVGFNDPKYFTRCFTKQFGIQPSLFMNEDIYLNNTIKSKKEN